MHTFVSEIIEAHGGLDRWNQFSGLKAHLVQGGALWALKGKASVLEDTSVTIDLTKQHALHAPFGDVTRKSSFTPARVELLSAAGEVLEALDDPRASFAGHTLETPWTDLQLAYFAGCAMWTYFSVPFVLSWPGVEVQELDPIEADGETLRRLRVRFPADITTHSTEQTLYIDAKGMLKRHDYDVEIAGNTPGAHFVSEYREVQGIKFPTSRRIYPRTPDGDWMPEPLVVSIDIDQITLS